jgi:hypothetical protein
MAFSRFASQRQPKPLRFTGGVRLNARADNRPKWNLIVHVKGLIRHAATAQGHLMFRTFQTRIAVMS